MTIAVKKMIMRLIFVAVLSVISLSLSIFIFYFIFDDIILRFSRPYLFILLRMILGGIIFIVLWSFVRGYIPRVLVLIVGFLYIGVLCSVILFRESGLQGVNINPLKMITDLKNDHYIVLANLLGFIPAGFFIKYFFPSVKNKWLFISGFIWPVLFECLQYILHIGISDIIDVIMNGTGFAIGIFSFSALNKWFPNRSPDA